MTEENATKLAPAVKAGKGGIVPPPERQFGKPNGNPRHNGAWKKEDTARYKLECMITLSRVELLAIGNDQNAPEFERKLALAIIKADWRTIESMMNQVYGAPKQRLEVEPVQPKPLIDLTEGKK